jgi:hypothetical protein
MYRVELLQPGYPDAIILRFEAADPDAAQRIASDVVPKAHRGRCRVVADETNGSNRKAAQ